MKILKTDKRLIDEGHRYKIVGDLISHEELDLMDLDKPLYVTGSIVAAWYIKAGGFIEAGGSIVADWYIKANGFIEAGESIKAGGYIKASGSIKAGRSIKAYGFIKASGFIEAGKRYGISAGLYIKAKTTITAGLNIFAGICTWRETEYTDKTVTCTELLGGATVEYGILNIVENEPDEVNTDNSEDIITLNGKKYKLIEG